jgi:hypothetical protein
MPGLAKKEQEYDDISAIKVSRAGLFCAILFAGQIISGIDKGMTNYYFLRG